MKWWKSLLRATLCLALVAASLPVPGRATVIPHDLDGRPLRTMNDPAAQAQAKLEAAGLTPDQARMQIALLKPAEVRQLAQADITQRGGDGAVTLLAIVGGLVLLIFIIKMFREANDDDDDTKVVVPAASAPATTPVVVPAQPAQTQPGTEIRIKQEDDDDD